MYIQRRMQNMSQIEKRELSRRAYLHFGRASCSLVVRSWIVLVGTPAFAEQILKICARHSIVVQTLVAEDKKARYSSRGGVLVFCLAAETPRRLHPSAGLARDRLTKSGVRAGAMLCGWRHQLLTALARIVAATLLLRLLRRVALTRKSTAQRTRWRSHECWSGPGG